MKIISWNVNGLRAIMKKDFAENVKKMDPDVLFLQEIKMQKEQVTEEIELREAGYKLEIFSGERKGYSGVAVYSRITPDRVYLGTGSEFDSEGRVIRLDFKNLSVYGIYFPNGGQGEERLAYKMKFYDHYLEEFKGLAKAGRNVVVCGDFNVAHEEIDLANPQTNMKKSGFLPIEREWFTKLLQSGFVDIFRNRYPDKVLYTWWDQRFKARDRNIGWRIDYFVLDEKTAGFVKDTEILNDFYGSDHCPIVLTLEGIV